LISKGFITSLAESYNIFIKHTKEITEVLLVKDGGLSSAYKKERDKEYCFNDKRARDTWRLIFSGLKLCKAKNAEPYPFAKGIAVKHTFTKAGTTYEIGLYNNEICELNIVGDKHKVVVEYDESTTQFPDVHYIEISKEYTETKMLEHRQVRYKTVDEVALENSDILKLRNKNFYIINNGENAERIFRFIEKFNGVVVFDTETTGLKINCFGKINSEYARKLAKWNEENPKDSVEADKLVGIVFCVEKDTAYYLPVRNKKFNNIYEDINCPYRKKIIQAVKEKFKYSAGDMPDYYRNTPEDEWTSDVVLMARVKTILETKHIAAANGKFDWKVCWLYEVDMNLKDDLILLHQLLYKFRDGGMKRSDLKHLSFVELGLKQPSLREFLPDAMDGDIDEDDGKVRDNKSERRVDFSDMEYEAAKLYACCDGDSTLQILVKYKIDLIKNHPKMVYIYDIEVRGACALGYTEFYGHVLDEKKIDTVKDMSKVKQGIVEVEIRKIVGYSNSAEISLMEELKTMYAEVEKGLNIGADIGSIRKEMLAKLKELVEVIEGNKDVKFNIGSPLQVAKLFYDDLKIPTKDGKRSVAESIRKQYMEEKNEEGEIKYPVVHLYDEYKKLDTLLTKFFDNLPVFMYPGGLIFSKFGQISTNTGRMNCSKPNAHQYPKDIKKIVIPRDGYTMLDVDYSQIECRIPPALAEEKGKVEMLADPDADTHTLTASLMFGVPYSSVDSAMRSAAKAISFGILFGMGYKSIALRSTGRAGAEEIKEAKKKYKLYFKDQPKVETFFDLVKEKTIVDGFTETRWYRPRYYNFLDSEGKPSQEKKAFALRQAVNAVIQGTAADIMKIALARVFTYIRNQKIYGDLLIVDIVHDEILFEVSCKLNVKKVIKEVKTCMQLVVEGFPPLYLGMGLGESWYKAKDSTFEIHPHLQDEISSEASDNLYECMGTKKEIEGYFNNRVIEFNRSKIIKYITDEKNRGVDMHPVIGKLINTNFSYGKKKAENQTDEQFAEACLAEFIKRNNLDVDTSWFKVKSVSSIDEDLDEAYLDGESEEFGESNFVLIDEDSGLYGCKINDLIRIFGYIISKQHKICGINVSNMGDKKKEMVIKYLSDLVCDDYDSGGLQIAFLQDNNILKYTGLYVKGIVEEDFHEIIGSKGEEVEENNKEEVYHI